MLMGGIRADAKTSLSLAIMRYSASFFAFRAWFYPWWKNPGHAYDYINQKVSCFYLKLYVWRRVKKNMHKFLEFMKYFICFLHDGGPMTFNLYHTLHFISNYLWKLNITFFHNDLNIIKINIVFLGAKKIHYQHLWNTK